MGEAIERDGGGVVVIVVVVVVVVVTVVVVVVVAAAAVVVVVAVVVAVVAVVVAAAAVEVVELVDGGRRDCIEAELYGGRRGGTVEVEGVGVDDPTFGIGEDSRRIGTSVGRGRNRKMRQRSGAVADQGA